jgi:hypothetical protein
MLKEIIDFLRGKKTYVIGFLMILLGVLQGNNELILEGLGLITLRVGVSKTLS